jgi:hypothetical protein
MATLLQDIPYARRASKVNPGPSPSFLMRAEALAEEVRDKYPLRNYPICFQHFVKGRQSSPPTTILFSMPCSDTRDAVPFPTSAFSFWNM